MRSYEQIFELGRGGMGVVQLACGHGAGGFENLVVLKRLHPHLTGDGNAVARFLNEAKVAALIHHANVVGTHYVGEDEAGYFLILDYVEGLSVDDLATRAKERGQTLAAPLVLRMALDALSGLSAVHEAIDPSGRKLNVLHRDVSPQNLLVGRDGVTRVADFGIARTSVQALTNPEYLVGKLCYLSPEYLRRQELGPNSDVYALSVSLWTVLCGHEPWPECGEAQLFRCILEERLPPLSGVAQVSELLSSIVSFGSEPNREVRYQSARAMADAIEAAAGQGERIASAREVAALVEELAGEELRARSERVAAWFAGQKRDHTERLQAPPRADASARTELAPRAQPQSGHSQPRSGLSQPPGWSRPPSSASSPPRGWSMASKAALAVALLLAAALAATFVTLREQRAPAAAAASSALTPVRSVAALEPPASPPTAEPAPSVVTSSAASAQRDERQAAPFVAPQTQPTVVQKLPNKIVTKNPYRDVR